MVKLTDFIKNYKKPFVIGPILKLFESIFELLTPIIMAQIIDVGIVNGDSSFILSRGGILFALAIGGAVFALTAQRIAVVSTQNICAEMRMNLFSHVGKISMMDKDRFGASSLTIRLTDDINQVQQALGMFIRLILRVPCLILGSLVMAMTRDLKISVIFWIAAPLIGLVLFLVMKYTAPLQRKIQKLLDSATVVLRENLSGTRVVRAFGKEREEQEVFSRATDDIARYSKSSARLSAILSPLTFLIINCAIIAILWFGGLEVNAGRVSRGDIVALTSYASQILLVVTAAATLTNVFVRAGASWGRIKEVLNTKKAEDGSLPLPDGPADIEIKNLSYSYPGGQRPALDGINLTIKSGEHIGIIGGTGSGKSTLADILTAIAIPDSGEVLYGGENIYNYERDGLRKKIRLATQHSVLFSGTVEENLRWGKEDATLEDFKTALALSACEEFIDADSGGLLREVARGGRNFSGGQRQRLSIARAVIGQPDLLILDDSFSALDYGTESAVRKAVFKQFKGKSVILISQRAHTVRYCDKILVLENGKADACGTHGELMESSAVYREIFLSQTKGGGL